MARPRPEKKSAPAAPIASKVLPMELRVGDRLADETGEWEVIGRPFTTAAGRTAHARVLKVGPAALTDLRTWGAHERVTVKRTSVSTPGNRALAPGDLEAAEKYLNGFPDDDAARLTARLEQVRVGTQRRQDG